MKSNEWADDAVRSQPARAGCFTKAISGSLVNELFDDHQLTVSLRGAVRFDLMSFCCIRLHLLSQNPLTAQFDLFGVRRASNFSLDEHDTKSRTANVLAELAVVSGFLRLRRASLDRMEEELFEILGRHL